MCLALSLLDCASALRRVLVWVPEVRQDTQAVFLTPKVISGTCPRAPGGGNEAMTLQ